jgi:hypothetical protein
MTITAKFSSTCPRCQEPIAPGTRVEWNPGEKARHTDCSPVAAVAAAVTPVQPVRVAVEDAGVYVLPNSAIVKVQANREKTRTYAKRWVVIGGIRLTEAGSREHGEYQYEPGLVQQVAAEGRKMTLDEAKAFILRYGQCVRCGRLLKDADSVEAGIGPVCIKYFTAGTTAASLLASRQDADDLAADNEIERQISAEPSLTDSEKAQDLNDRQVFANEAAARVELEALLERAKNITIPALPKRPSWKAQKARQLSGSFFDGLRD